MFFQQNNYISGTKEKSKKYFFKKKLIYQIINELVKK